MMVLRVYIWSVEPTPRAIPCSCYFKKTFLGGSYCQTFILGPAGVAFTYVSDKDDFTQCIQN